GSVVLKIVVRITGAQVEQDGRRQRIVEVHALGVRLDEGASRRRDGIGQTVGTAQRRAVLHRSLRCGPVIGDLHLRAQGVIDLERGDWGSPVGIERTVEIIDQIRRRGTFRPRNQAQKLYRGGVKAIQGDLVLHKRL